MREAAGGAFRADEAGREGAPMMGPIRHVHNAINATQRNSMIHLASISRQLARQRGEGPAPRRLVRAKTASLQPLITPLIEALKGNGCSK